MATYPIPLPEHEGYSPTKAISNYSKAEQKLGGASTPQADSGMGWVGNSYTPGGDYAKTNSNSASTNLLSYLADQIGKEMDRSGIPFNEAYDEIHKERNQRSDMFKLQQQMHMQDRARQLEQGIPAPDPNRLGNPSELDNQLINSFQDKGFDVVDTEEARNQGIPIIHSSGDAPKSLGTQEDIVTPIPPQYEHLDLTPQQRQAIYFNEVGRHPELSEEYKRRYKNGSINLNNGN